MFLQSYHLHLRIHFVPFNRSFFFLRKTELLAEYLWKGNTVFDKKRKAIKSSVNFACYLFSVKSYPS